MVALDRVCHSHGCRFDKTLERASSFVTSAFNCSCCHVLIERERRLRIGGLGDWRLETFPFVQKEASPKREFERERVVLAECSGFVSIS